MDKNIQKIQICLIYKLKCNTSVKTSSDVFVSVYITLFPIDFAVKCIYLQCKSQYLGITCVYMLDIITEFCWSFSNFRGLVPAPIINNLRYFTALELKKSFGFMGIILKPPLDLLERGELSFVGENKLFSAGWLQPWCLSLDFQRIPDAGKQAPP